MLEKKLKNLICPVTNLKYKIKIFKKKMIELLMV